MSLPPFNIWSVIFYNHSVDDYIYNTLNDRNQYGLRLYGNYRCSFIDSTHLTDASIIKKSSKVFTKVGIYCSVFTIEKLYNYRLDIPKNPAVLFIDTYGIRDDDLQLAKEACLPESLWGIKTYTFDKLNKVIDKINMIESIG